MPAWLEPMAATLTQDRQQPQNSQNNRDEWLFERKFDGIRLIAYKRNGDVKLYSRNRLTQHIPTIESAIAREKAAAFAEAAEGGSQLRQ